MLGTVDPQTELLDAEQLCGHLVVRGTIHRHLAELGDRLFRDADFADLYHPGRGRHSVPPSLLAKVLLLQSLEGTSDRETIDRVRCDLRWKVALRLSLTDEGFHPTVLTYFRERLRVSEHPRRIFDRFKQVATESGLLTRGGVRVLDSTPVLSAVQTQDTVSLIRGAMRRLLRLLASSDPAAGEAVEAVLQRGDCATGGKPPIDWDDEEQRGALVDELVRDALAGLAVLEGRQLSKEIGEAAALLATVAGQDVEEGPDGRFRIRRGVAKDRVVSVVDPEARHGHKSNHRSFDGYKAHIAIEPKTELVTEVEVTSANTNDAGPIEELLPELEGTDDQDADLTVVADSAYGSGPARKRLEETGARAVIKAPPEINSTGGFPKSAFAIDLDTKTAICPAGVTTKKVKTSGDGSMQFLFGGACASCALRSQCTSARDGRRVTVGPHERLLAAARSFQRTEQFKQIYNGIRPTVERVISRMVRTGGRKARYRGCLRVGEQVRLRAAGQNLCRMVRLGLAWTPEEGWVTT